MIEFWNVIVAAICAFILGATIHSAYRHSFDGKGRFKGLLRKGLRSILEWEERLLMPIPNHWVKVSYTEVVEALIKAFPMADQIFITDSEYYLCPKKDIEDFLAKDPTEKESYVWELHDCDDFSFRLMGQFHTKPYSALAFGIAWSEVHAYNACVVTEDRKVWIIEPQTDQLISPEQADKNYETRLVFM